jgi:hypothetical protein
VKNIIYRRHHHVVLTSSFPEKKGYDAVSLRKHPLNPKTEIEPRISRKGTDEERVMETIFKPVWCILKSVKIRVI